MSKNDAVADKFSSVAFSDTDGHLEYEGPRKEEGAGAFLKNARLLQGMDIGALASLLKVPVHKLQAIEQGRSDALQDPVFTRALASSMCRILKLDPGPVLQKLPAITAFKAVPQNRGINAAFRSRGGKNATSIWSHISRPAVWFGLALMAGALVLLFLPFVEGEFARLQQSGKLEFGSGQAVPPAAVTTTVVTPLIRNDNAVGAADNLATGTTVPAEVTVVAPGPAALSAPPLISDDGDATSAAIITLTAKGASSVKVTDANGVVVFNRVLRAGEAVGLSGAVPLSVVVGRADSVQVQVRGMAFNLNAVSRNNTARFEVK